MGALALCALASALLLATPGAAGPPLQRRLLQWNVGTINPFDFRLPQRFEAKVVAGIADANPDVACLQELRSEAQVARIVSALLLRGHTFQTVTQVNNASRGDGRLTAVFYRLDRLAEPKREFVSTGGYRAAALVFDDYTLAFCHGPAGFSAEREVYFRELGAWVDGLPQPVVLAGDLNIGPRHSAGVGAVWPPSRREDRRTFNAFVQRFSARTSFKYTTFYRFELDHVLLSQGTIVQQQVLKGKGRFPMDHCPLLIDLQVPRRSVTASPGMAGALSTP